MKVWITVKSLGKRKPVLAKQAAELPETTSTLRLLIENMVEQQVQAFREEEHRGMLVYLMPDDIDAQSAAGKVGFGTVRGEVIPDLGGERSSDTCV